MRRINDAGLAIIKQFEGCELTAYRCPAGVLTIGYGSTGPHVKEGMRITEAQAVALLRKDVERFERGVDAHLQDATDNQFSACVSLAFNIGLANFAGSSVLREHRNRHHLLAADAFLRWNKAKVKGVLTPLKGLTRRRQAEAALYRKGGI